MEPQVGWARTIWVAQHGGQSAVLCGPGNSLVALNATTGDALWHTRLNAAISNGPITYELDGLQYVIVGASDMLWAFVMNKP